jgi:NAD(P)-dependent dehydrogenase (short-subunit alcohol dehydrogenase family)
VGPLYLCPVCTLKGLQEHATYAATKAAIRSFARTLAMELKDRGIRVNTLSPGTVDTPIQFRSKEEANDTKAFFSGITPPGRIGRSEETASASLRTRVVILLGSIWWRLAASRRFELGGSARGHLRNLREVRAMQQQTAYSSWITVPVG